jgi:hypothetical protein
MNAAVVSYFTSHNIRVMLSIGGITYTSDWDTPHRSAVVHQCVPRDSSLRRHRSQSRGAVDD